MQRAFLDRELHKNQTQPASHPADEAVKEREVRRHTHPQAFKDKSKYKPEDQQTRTALDVKGPAHMQYQSSLTVRPVGEQQETRRYLAPNRGSRDNDLFHREMQGGCKRDLR